MREVLPVLKGHQALPQDFQETAVAAETGDTEGKGVTADKEVTAVIITQQVVMSIKEGVEPSAAMAAVGVMAVTVEMVVLEGEGAILQIWGMLIFQDQEEGEVWAAEAGTVATVETVDKEGREQHQVSILRTEQVDTAVQEAAAVMEKVVTVEQEEGEELGKQVLHLLGEMVGMVLTAVSLLGEAVGVLVETQKMDAGHTAIMVAVVMEFVLFPIWHTFDYT